MKMFGHVFAPRNWIRPFVVMVRHQIREQGLPRRKYRFDNAWVYDYSFTQCGSYRIKNRRAPWEGRGPMEGHLYPPGTDFWEKSGTRAETCRSAYVLFTGARGMAMERLIGRDSGWACFSDPSGLTGNLLMEMAQTASEGKEGSVLAVHSLFLEMMDLLMKARTQGDGKHLVSKEGHGAGSDTPLVQKACSFFRDHLRESVTLERLSREIMVGPSTLSHSYKQETGESPMATLRRMRLAHARLMLLSQERLKVIARETGFCDAYHLSKAFKQAEGMSPREYLRRYSTR